MTVWVACKVAGSNILGSNGIPLRRCLVIVACHWNYTVSVSLSDSISCFISILHPKRYYDEHRLPDVCLVEPTLIVLKITTTVMRCHIWFEDTSRDL